MYGAKIGIELFYRLLPRRWKLHIKAGFIHAPFIPTPFIPTPFIPTQDIGQVYRLSISLDNIIKAVEAACGVLEV